MYRFLACIFCSIFLINAEYYYEKGKKVELVKLDQSRSSSGSTITNYRTSAGRIFSLQNQIIVKSEKKNIETILNKYPVQVADTSVSGFILLTLKDGEDLFSIVRQLSEESFIEMAQPDFKRERRSR